MSKRYPRPQTTPTWTGNEMNSVEKMGSLAGISVMSRGGRQICLPHVLPIFVSFPVGGAWGRG